MKIKNGMICSPRSKDTLRGKMTETKNLTCQKPDRDAPMLICGYPLPCPYHTINVEVEDVKQLPKVAEALSKGKGEWN